MVTRRSTVKDDQREMSSFSVLAILQPASACFLLPPVSPVFLETPNCRIAKLLKRKEKNPTSFRFASICRMVVLVISATPTSEHICIGGLVNSSGFRSSSVQELARGAKIHKTPYIARSADMTKRQRVTECVCLAGAFQPNLSLPLRC